MQGMTIAMIQTGDYLKFQGRSARKFGTQWWKAIKVEPLTVHLVNRYGQTCRVSTKWKYQECRAIKWEPGDDRND